MKIAVTGIAGQVASCLLAATAARRDIEVIALGRPGLELLDKSTVRPALERARPDIVVSAAAYTAVDQAEDEPGLAYRINAEGAGAVAAAAAAVGAPVIHLSTDYVFDGNSKRCYREDDPTNPQNAYGASKLAGELAVAAANPRRLILRTAWVYSPFGNNFVRTMLRLAKTREEIAVVADQIGNPTSAFDIAHGIIVAARRVIEDEAFERYGVYNLVGQGESSWSDFARRVFTTSRRHGGPHASVRDISTADYPTKAKRPANSRLSTEKFASTFGWMTPFWQESADEVVKQLVRAEHGFQR